MNYNDTLDLLKITLYGKYSEDFLYEEVIKISDWKEQYELFNSHTIAPLVSELDKYIPNNDDVKKDWKESVYSNIYTYSNLVKKQKQILGAFNGIPVVVVKGTSAAKYYPKPQLRTMGDIDLLVNPKDYDTAVVCLINAGCVEITSNAEAEAGRHRSFNFSNISIELHHYISSYSENDEEKTLDNLLYNAISPNSTELPDVENGLVLLSHIRQHLEGGLGLRQIIDWFMFVRSCLNDEMWYNSFRAKAQVTGLESLAITVTKMCQKYLGLTTENITWCKDADDSICDDLMQYVMECGNFGRSRDMLQSRSASQLPSIKHPIQLFKFIQSHGECNWKALKKHPNLKPFAWIYQSCRYTKMAVQNRVGAKKLKDIYDEGQKRNEMFVALGIK